MSQMIRILIADDFGAVVDGLKIRVNQAPDMTVVGIIKSALLVKKGVEKLNPDVLLMDLMWGVDEDIGWQVIAKIRDEHPDIKIIAITAHQNLVGKARSNGANAAILKPFKGEDLYELIRDVYKYSETGELNPHDMDVLIERLSPREHEVLQMLDAGLTNKEISSKLIIEPSTVKNHVKSILAKLNAGNRGKAVSIARDRGII